MVNVKIGALLDAYNDGKISPSRLSIIVVDDVVPRRGLYRRESREWRKALREDMKETFEGNSCWVDGPNQFWDWNCDEFIIGHFYGSSNKVANQVIFAKQAGNRGWYGVNWNFKLDLTGKFRRHNIKAWRECASSMGQKMVWNKKTAKYDYIDIKTGKVVC